jgi:L-lactate permease
MVSSFLAAIPILVVLLLLGVMRTPAWIAGVSGLAVTFVVALGGYHMPLTAAVSAAGEGTAFGLFPISWIVFWAIALFRVTRETGNFEIIKDSLGKLTIDPRLQALLIAFAFGAFIEGAAGFGTPVAIASTMLTGLGFSAFDASALCLLANTAPVAFGSVGIPIITLALTTGLSVDKLSASADLLCTPVALIIPAYLIASRWGLRGLKGAWLPAIAAGSVFAFVQLVVSTLVGAQLTDILASLAAIAALILIIRTRRSLPTSDFSPSQDAQDPSPHVAAQAVPKADLTSKCTASQLINAWLPYVFLVICVLLWGWTPIHAALESRTISFKWPLLHDVILRMPPIVSRPAPYHAVFSFDWFAASGTSCMAATLLTALCFRLRPS